MEGPTYKDRGDTVVATCFLHDEALLSPISSEMSTLLHIVILLCTQAVRRSSGFAFIFIKIGIFG